jgi:hypothetical protein
MKLKRDQVRWLDWIREHGTPHGMTLGRGRPHDRRVIQSLIDLYWLKPIFPRPDVLQNEYAVRGEEDQYGLALLVCRDLDIVAGATHYGVRVQRFSDDDYSRDPEGSALQNGEDTAWEYYPDDEIRREWMCWAVARSTLAMND